MVEYAAFLRGINVGGHHKVPMAQLKNCLEDMGFENVKTLLNSGNVVFGCDLKDTGELEKRLETKLAEVFGFGIPCMVISKKELLRWIEYDPFSRVETHPDIRLYISIIRSGSMARAGSPDSFDDGAFTIISREGRMVASVLDLSLSKTVKGMEALEKMYGKDITTRNWNTIQKIAKLF